MKKGRAGAIALLLVSAGLLCGPAPAAQRGYIVTDFDSVRLEAPIAVTVQTRRGVSARGEGDADLLDRIDLSVSDRTLHIRLKPSPYEGRRPTAAVPAAKLFLTAPALRRLQLDGAGTLGADALTARRAELIAAGSGMMTVAGIAADNLVVAQVGAGTMRLSGKAGTVTMRLSGSGGLDAAALSIADLHLDAEGSGAVRALAIRTARVVALGSGSVAVGGKPACTVRHAGSGTVRCAGKDF